MPLMIDHLAAPAAFRPQDVRCGYPGAQEQGQASGLLGHRVSLVYEFGACIATQLLARWLITAGQSCGYLPAGPATFCST